MSDVKGGSLSRTVFSRCLTSIFCFFVAATFAACAWDEFEGPQGDQGPQGETGDTGPQGDQGPQGETGEPGVDYPDCNLRGNECEVGYVCDSRGRCILPIPDEGSGEGSGEEVDLCPDSIDLTEPVTYYGDLDRDSVGESDVEISVCEETAPAGYTDSADGDNCPLVANADQLDTDADGLGDACDTVVTPPPAPTTITIEVRCTSLCQAHLYYGVEDQMGLSPFIFEVPRDQACENGIEVKGRVPSGNWPWYGDSGAPAMSSVTVLIEGVVTRGVLRVTPWTNAEGNLYFSRTQLGCR